MKTIPRIITTPYLAIAKAKILLSVIFSVAALTWLSSPAQSQTITSVVPKNGQVTINWTGASGPVQVQKALKLLAVTDPTTGAKYLDGNWQDVDLPNSSGQLVTVQTDPTAYYRIKGTGAGGGGTDRKPPTVPTGVTATANTCSQITVSWVASTDPNTSSGMKGYNVYRNGVFLKQVLVPATTTSDVGLSANTTYSYAVCALDNAGNVSAKSTAVSATTPACPIIDSTPPATPASLTATPVSCGQINLSWTASSDTGGSGLKSYQLYRNNVLLKEVTAPTTSFSDSGLAASTAYNYAVLAVDNAGNASMSASASGTTPACVDGTAPSAPTGLTVAAASCSQINLSWAASTDTGGSGLSGYYIYRGGVFLKQVAGTSTSDASLAASTSYSYAVSAVDNAGNESARTTGSATTPACADVIPPSTPTGLTVTAASCSQINLSWTASTDTGGSGLKSYQLYRNNVFLREVVAPTTSFSDSGLTASTAYSYAVQAVDNAGNASLSASASATTPACADVTAPSTPTSLTVAAASCSQINLSWGGSTDNTGGSGLKGYNVYRNGTFLKLVTGATSTSDGSVAASTSYSYAVSAVDNAGNQSPQTAATSATTPACADVTPPTVPTGLTVTASTCSQINLSWGASTDSGSGLKGYNVYRNGALLKLVTGATSTSDGSLAASTSYSYAVSAVDNAGNPSAQTAAMSATTPACPDTTAPSVPAGLTATAASTTQINLAWSASTDTG